LDTLIEDLLDISKAKKATANSNDSNSKPNSRVLVAQNKGKGSKKGKAITIAI